MHRTIPAIAAGLALAASPALAADVTAVASFSILADIVQQVGGDRVAVTTIVGPNADAHVYEPTPADAAAVTRADIFFVNGLGFEGWMDRLVEATGYGGPLVVASAGVVPHTMAEDEDEDEDEAHDHDHDDHDHDHDHDHHHDHGGVDPHAWQDLANGALYARNVAAGLCDVDAAGCTVYTANADAYAAQLMALDAEIRADVAAIPEARRKVITTHDAFGYFGAAYGVTFLAPEGVSTEAEASAAAVARLITQIREEDVSAVFIENMTDGRLVQQIAAETGTTLGGELYADALSEPGGPAAHYIDMLRHNAELLIPAMEGR